MRNNILTVIGFLVFGAIVVAPPLLYGYVYPNIGDDSAGYLAIFDSMKKGIIGPNVQYSGYLLTGYPLAYLSKWTGATVDSLFLWFNYAALIGAGLAIYYVVSRLVGRLAGWLALSLVLFCAQGILFQFYYGQIYNLINMGIILPLLLLFTVRYLKHPSWWRLILTIVFVGLFCGFHTSGIYLPAIAGVVTGGYLVYCLVRKVKIKRHVVAFGGGTVIFGGAMFVLLVLLPTLEVIALYYEEFAITLLSKVGQQMAVPIGSYMMSIFSPTLLVLFALSVVYFKEIRAGFHIGETKMFGTILLGFVFVLGLSAFAKLSLDPWRQALDFATVSALFIAICIGLLLNQQKAQWLKIAVALSIIGFSLFQNGFGLFQNLSTWFGYNSAIRAVDLEALAYADNYRTFSCSGTVAPWIYSRFTEAEWLANEGEVVIVRSKPMTPRSTEGNIWYQSHGWKPDNSYELSKVFSDGNVDIEIYESQEYIERDAVAK